MSTRLEAQRRLHQHAKNGGNWRFKGLLLAELGGVSREHVADAWPDPGQKSDYRFLSEHGANVDGQDAVDSYRAPDVERNRRVLAEPGTDRHRFLTDYAGDEVRELNDRGTVGIHLDKAVKRSLFAGATPEELDVLWREQLLETVVEGAERRKVIRDASDVLNVDTISGSVPIAEDENYAPKIGQGAEIRDDREQYVNLSWDAEKIAKGSRVTDEMVDHGIVDLVERNIQKTGAAVENSMNRMGLMELVDNRGGTHTPADTTELGVPAINGAYGLVDKNDFVPDAFMTAPMYRTSLFDDSNIAFANRAGTDDVIRERVFDPLLSIEHYGASSSTYLDSGDDPEYGFTPGAETWGFENTGDIGALVYSTDHIHSFIYSANGTGIEIKEYDDPIRDLTGMNARVHFDAQVSQERAVAGVAYP